MQYRNAQYTKSGDIDLELKHPVLGWIKSTLSLADPETSVMFSEVAFGEVKPYVGPEHLTKVPYLKLRAAAIALGFSDKLEAASFDPWFGSGSVDKSDAGFLAFAHGAGLTDSQIDKLFQTAPTSDTTTVAMQQIGRLAATKADMLGVAAALESKADVSALPLPAQDMPPAVASTGRRGTLDRRYAMADHTHADPPIWVRKNQVSNASGVYEVALPPNLFSESPAVFVSVKAPAGSFDVRAEEAGGSVKDGFKIKVTFRKQRETLSLTVGNLLNVNLLDAPVAVTFDIMARQAAG